MIFYTSALFGSTLVHEGAAVALDSTALLSRGAMIAPELGMRAPFDEHVTALHYAMHILPIIQDDYTVKVEDL